MQTVEVTIDALVSREVMPFWRAVLGYEYRSDSPDEDLVDPRGRGPSFWFQPMDAPRPQRNRVHIDVWVPHDQAEARVAAALAAGGRLVSDEHAPEWWTLADAEATRSTWPTCWSATEPRHDTLGRLRTLMLLFRVNCWPDRVGVSRDGLPLRGRRGRPEGLVGARRQHRRGSAAPESFAQAAARQGLHVDHLTDTDWQPQRRQRWLPQSG